MPARIGGKRADRKRRDTRHREAGPRRLTRHSAMIDDFDPLTRRHDIDAGRPPVRALREASVRRDLALATELLLPLLCSRYLKYYCGGFFFLPWQ